MARTFINLGFEQPPAANDTPLSPRPFAQPSSPGVVVEGEAPTIAATLMDAASSLVKLTAVNPNGSTKVVWINPAYVRLVAEAA